MMHHLPTMSGGGLPEDSPANELSQSTADITPDPAKMDEIAPKVIEALKTVYDPEIPVNIFEMGLIYDVVVDANGQVGVKMTLTAPACPAAQSLPSRSGIRRKASKASRMRRSRSSGIRHGRKTACPTRLSYSSGCSRGS